MKAIRQKLIKSLLTHMAFILFGLKPNIDWYIS